MKRPSHIIASQLIIIIAVMALCPLPSALAGPLATSTVGRSTVKDAVRVQKRGVKPQRFQRLRKGFRAIKQRLRLPPKLKRKIRRGVKIAKGYGTIAADKIQRSLPRRLSKGFAKVRLMAPTTLGGYAGSMFKKDPVFLGSFGVAYPIATHLQIPAFVYLGMDPVTALVVHEVTEIPLSLGILAWRQHHIREDRSQNFGGTLKKMGVDYRAFAKKEQASSRRYMKAYKRLKQRNQLRKLSAGLNTNQPLSLAAATQ